MQRVEVRILLFHNFFSQFPKIANSNHYETISWDETNWKQEVLANHDIDGDGKISRKEYTSHMYRLKYTWESMQKYVKQYTSHLYRLVS